MTHRKWVHVLAALLFVVGVVQQSSHATVQFAGNSNLSATQQQQVRDAFEEAKSAVANVIYYLRGNALTNINGNGVSYNQYFGPLYNQRKAAPFIEDGFLPAYRASLLQDYSLVRQKPLGDGVGGNIIFAFNGNTPYRNDVFVGDKIYVTPTDELYPLRSRQYAYGPLFVTTLAVTATTTTTTGGRARRTSTTTSTTTTTGNQTLNTLTYNDRLRIPISPTYNPALDGLLERIRPVVGADTALNTQRYKDLLFLMERVQTTLNTVNFNVSGNLEANRAQILTNTNLTFLNQNLTNIGLSGNGTLNIPANSPLPAIATNRGFQQYGYSNSNSTQKLAQDIATPANPRPWYLDMGDLDNDGVLDANETNYFFRDKFTALMYDTTSILATAQTSATLFLGQAALNEEETATNGIFDSTNRAGTRQRTSPLFQNILESVIAMLNYPQNGNSFIYNRTQINTRAGNTNRDVFTNQFFPQDKDIKNIGNLTRDIRPATQGGSANSVAGAPPGKNVIAGGAYQKGWQDHIIVIFR